jgi:uncharacterized protein (DUF885 family)
MSGALVTIRLVHRLGPSLALCLAASAVGCRREPFPDVAQDFVYGSLAFAPGLATQIGLHDYVDPRSRDTLHLDAMLDDFSAANRERQRAFYSEFQRRLKATNRDRLDAQTQADYDLLSDAAALALFSLDKERFAERRPQLYPEVLGNALFTNISLEYADTAQRAAHLAARLGRVPAYIETALTNLTASNDVYRRVAIEEMAGVSEMITTTGAQFVRGTKAEQAYASAQPAALAAIARFSTFVRDSLPRLATVDWRMGREMFDTKWRYYLQSTITPEQMLKSAEDSMVTIRSQMFALAWPLHDAWFPGHRHAASDTLLFQKSVVGEVLGHIGEEHANRDSLETQARKDVDMLAAFVRERRVLSLTDFSNVKIIPTPVFMRGVYGVAGAVFAPALQPKLSSFYWVTPIPKEWPDARADGRLREYNHYKMLSLTIHEALPGHLVQGEYANRVTPEWRRALRVVFGNGAYIEGWAVYAEHAMERLGMTGGDSVKARLTALKAMLRVYSNVVIDARLHTGNMPTDSVVPYLVRDAFQEEPEATAKLQRAQLDYVQLNLYPVGLHEWWALRREAERREGAAFNLCRFHDTVLSYGPVPVPTAARLYLDHVAPTADMPPSRCDVAAAAATTP